MPFLVNLLISATLISTVVWVSKRSPQLGGFLVALPVSTMIVLALTHGQYKDPALSVQLAKSIFAAVPLSLLFFVPFLLAERLGWPFWALYGAGTALLGVGYLMHRLILPLL